MIKSKDKKKQRVPWGDRNLKFKYKKPIKESKKSVQLRVSLRSNGNRKPRFKSLVRGSNQKNSK